VVPTIEETLEHFWGTLPYILFAVVAIAWMKASGSERLLDGAFKGRETPDDRDRRAGGRPVALLLLPGHSLRRRASGRGRAALGRHGVLAVFAADGPGDVRDHRGRPWLRLRGGQDGGGGPSGSRGRLHREADGVHPVFADPLKAQISTGGCCGAKKLSLKWQFWGETERRRIFRDSGWSNLVFLGKWLLLAYLLQALLIAYVPAELVATVIGGDGVGPILLATIVGAPAYLNGYAAIPLLEGLIGQGMNPGAAMAFVIAGGVSSIPAAVAVWALVKPRVFAAYIAFALIGAFAAGLIWSAIA
jgi:hypothetical protein